MILWDSRTIHCSTPALHTTRSHPPNQLLRAASYISMVPFRLASDAAVQNRIRAYEYNQTTTHWPHLVPDIKLNAQAVPVRRIQDASEEVKWLVGIR